MFEFGRYYFDLNILVDILVHNPLAVILVGALILLGAFLLYWIWFRPPVVTFLIALKQLAQTLSKSPKDWVAVKERARAIAKAHPMLAVAWMETEERVVALPMGGTRAYMMFGSPRDLWSPQQLLARRINLPLAEAVPNLLVGFGLLLTFFFLTLALSQATSALGAQAGAESKILQATHGLLGAAGAKFSTSLAGLLASVVWTIFYKHRLAQLSRACEEVLAALANVAPVGGGELTMMRQVDLASEALATNKALLQELRQPVGVFRQFEDILAINEELLEEVREQHGTLKRFETDLAVSLANAINPQMQSMTSKLVEAIDGLSNKLGTMNQQALEDMMKEYAATLKKATNTEMTQLLETLKYLTGQLDGAGKNIGEGVTKAATDIDQASANLVAQVGKASENLMESATKLEEATVNVKTAMDDLDVSIKDAADEGRKGVQVVSSFIQNAKQVVVDLSGVSNSLGQTSTALQSVSGEIASVVDNVEELSREQQNVIQAVRDVTPAALNAIKEVSKVLETSAEETKTAVTTTKNAMEATAKNLAGTVAAINAGVKTYTDDVVKLHLQIDGSLARAVGSFDKGITGLEEGISGLEDAVEGLGEIMKLATKRRP